MRWARVLLVPVLMLLFVACSSSDDDANGDGGSSSATETATATADAGGGSGGTTVTDGDGVITEEDIDRLVDELAPPNSTEASRFSAEGGTTVGFESSDSVETLKEFYDGRLQELGMHVQGSLSAEGSHSLIIGDDDGDDVAGGITIVPDESGGSVVVLNLVAPS